MAFGSFGIASRSPTGQPKPGDTNSRRTQQGVHLGHPIADGDLLRAAFLAFMALDAGIGADCLIREILVPAPRTLEVHYYRGCTEWGERLRLSDRAGRLSYTPAD